MFCMGGEAQHAGDLLNRENEKVEYVITHSVNERRGPCHSRGQHQRGQYVLSGHI